VTLSISIHERPELTLEYLVLDVNGTITNRGVLIEGVEERIDSLRKVLDVRLVSADTFGTLDTIAERLQATPVRVGSGVDKLRALDMFGRDRCAVIGNGANDALILEAAAIGFVVVGPEGASAGSLRVADVVCASAVDALDLLLDTKALSATLRG